MDASLRERVRIRFVKTSLSTNRGTYSIDFCPILQLIGSQPQQRQKWMLKFLRSASQFQRDIRKPSRSDHQMTEQTEEATRLSAPFAESAKAGESLSAALSREIALKNQTIAAREAEIARLQQRIAEMDARSRAAMGPRDSVATAARRALQFYVLAHRGALAICQARSGAFPDA